MSERPLADHLDDAFGRDELASSLVAVERGIRRRRATRRAAMVGAALLPLIAVGVWLSTRPGPPPPQQATAAAPAVVAPLATTEGRALPPSLSDAGVVDLDDGSRLTVRPGSELSVAANERGVAAFALGRGVVRFDIRPGGPRRWRVLAGPLQIEVLGTAFTVRRDGDQASVAVHRGVVSVVTAEGARRLVAGERLAIGEPEPTVDAVEVEASEATEEAPRAGATPTVETLLGRADAHRRAGQLDDAVRALRAIVETHADAPEAPSAALSWGQIEEDRGHPERAARAYRRALGLSPPPALRELCYLRLVRVELASGDRARAEATARQHTARYGRGAHGAAIEALLQR
ncbi:MAG: FecR domain-containing protein [Sandaracinaceae bacterium]|nr:FecR domain-containing protein [Sandaracinaceae bacterium]